MGYMLVYFMKGRLPWQGIVLQDKLAKQKAIERRKEEISHEELCRGCPQEFIKLLQHCEGLRYDEPPHYNYLRTLIKEACFRKGIQCDSDYDWMSDPSGTHTYLPEQPKERKRRSSKGDSGPLLHMPDNSAVMRKSHNYTAYQHIPDQSLMVSKKWSNASSDPGAIQEKTFGRRISPGESCPQRPLPDRAKTSMAASPARMGDSTAQLQEPRRAWPGMRRRLADS
eukprot:gnl/TRDRNA2_/TRDRNA2_72302_c0_seq1.p1 gnl/TRDRNA2_/TRDRNA2_72302_c0~~gnl/TRDRNA2_/TRDRNA2_72302_c0_seq1.p1  ORF type:complete len:256 (-),score=31.17 gnl/TRDRNA2_/TRDRNA2_72302_c0_seq1:74-748(-)